MASLQFAANTKQQKTQTFGQFVQERGKGATGVSGKYAIQAAELLGAGRVVGTGRNEEVLQNLDVS